MASKGWFSKRGLSKAICATAMAVTAGTFAIPAAAQFFPFDDRFFGQQPQRQYRPRAPVEQEDQSRAPAPKPPEVAPSIRILVLGDSLADWLSLGLEEQLAETPEIGIVRKHRAFSGLIRYDSKNEAAEWPQIARDLIAAEKPQAVIMLVGVHDRQAIRERAQAARAAPAKGAAAADAQKTPAQNAQPAPGVQAQNDEEPPAIAAPEPQRARPTGPVEFRSEKWEELYGARVDETIAALKSANVPVLWVGLPAIRGVRSTADAQYLNEIYRARAEKAGILYVDVWDGFVDQRNNFVNRGPDVEGQIRQLRTGDGVHLTRFGARKLAHYVERDLRRVLREPIPVALTTPAEPVPAQPAKPSGPAARPLAGPVLLLGSPLNEPDDLLGGGPVKNATLDAVATRTLVKGEPSSVSAGRADDFAWPPRLPNLAVSEPLPPTGPPIVAVRPAPKPVVSPQQALAPGQPGPGRVAGQQALQGQARQQSQQQAPTFWRRQAPQYDGPRGFFGLFGGR